MSWRYGERTALTDERKQRHAALERQRARVETVLAFVADGSASSLARAVELQRSVERFARQAGGAAAAEVLPAFVGYLPHHFAFADGRTLDEADGSGGGRDGDGHLLAFETAGETAVERANRRTFVSELREAERTYWQTVRETAERVEAKLRELRTEEREAATEKLRTERGAPSAPFDAEADARAWQHERGWAAHVVQLDEHTRRALAWTEKHDSGVIETSGGSIYVDPARVPDCVLWKADELHEELRAEYVLDEQALWDAEAEVQSENWQAWAEREFVSALEERFGLVDIRMLDEAALAKRRTEVDAERADAERQTVLPLRVRVSNGYSAKTGKPLTRRVLLSAVEEFALPPLPADLPKTFEELSWRAMQNGADGWTGEDEIDVENLAKHVSLADLALFDVTPDAYAELVEGSGEYALSADDPLRGTVFEEMARRGV